MLSKELLREKIALLSKMTPDDRLAIPCQQLPSLQALCEIVALVKDIVFPAYFDDRQGDAMYREYHIGVKVERLSVLLSEQISLALRFENNLDEDLNERANECMMEFINALPEIKRLLYTDVEAIYDNDPAVHNYSEVIFCYPVIQAMLHYRVAHQLHLMKVPILPRILTEHAHSSTGIDINPGAQIGEYFAIIGNHVTIYQGVTLGAKNFQIDDNGRPVNVPRHPIIGDNVTIYANSTILGRITIGHNTVIGGNIWLTHSVPPGSRILQSKAVDVSFTGGLGI